MAEIRLVPEQCDVSVYAGDQNRCELEILADGDPVDLTGAVLTAQARKTAGDTEIAVEATFVEVEYASGRVAMLWDGEQVRTVLAGEDKWVGVWDLQVVLPPALPVDGDRAVAMGLPTTILAGKFQAFLDVTRVAP